MLVPKNSSSSGTPHRLIITLYLYISILNLQPIYLEESIAFYMMKVRNSFPIAIYGRIIIRI